MCYHPFFISYDTIATKCLEKFSVCLFIKCYDRVKNVNKLIDNIQAYIQNTQNIITSSTTAAFYHMWDHLV